MKSKQQTLRLGRVVGLVAFKVVISLGVGGNTASERMPEKATYAQTFQGNGVKTPSKRESEKPIATGGRSGIGGEKLG